MSIPSRTKNFIREASVLSAPPSFDKSSQSSSRFQHHQAKRIVPTTPTPSAHHQPIFSHFCLSPYLPPSGKFSLFFYGIPSYETFYFLPENSYYKLEKYKKVSTSTSSKASIDSESSDEQTNPPPQMSPQDMSS
ncbi:hypothetical protein O181_075734 [Austropuccinia psidii MF-1]|uniref:Uncharacterized protein n=1 Tax=Austropuccinia psidii MF-1 TaxID=1389203 RepID=A0A9Q3IER3_9BASI|nr:hypothetical protein [Austropuccinia psidii MF-1]